MITIGHATADSWLVAIAEDATRVRILQSLLLIPMYGKVMLAELHTQRRQLLDALEGIKIDAAFSGRSSTPLAPVLPTRDSTGLKIVAERLQRLHDLLDGLQGLRACVKVLEVA